MVIGSVSSDQIADRSITAGKLATGSVDGSTLSIGSVRMEHLSNEVIDQLKLANDNVDNSEPEGGSASSIGADQITSKSIGIDKLSINPLEISASKQKQFQQYGLQSFTFLMQDVLVEVKITFDEQFADTHYIFVAMTNHPACYSFIKNKSKDHYIIQLSRSKFSPELTCFINWIAVGTRS